MDDPTGVRPSPVPDRSTPGTSRWWVPGAVVVLAFIVILGGWGMEKGHRSTGDSNLLVVGTRISIECIRDGQVRECGWEPEMTRSTVGAFPLLQYLPAAGLVQLGLDDGEVLLAFAWLSFGAFLATAALLIAAAPRPERRTWRPLLAVFAVSGPLVVYATSAFGEMLATFIVLAAVVAVRYRRPLAIFGLVTLACLAKETLPPFVIALGILAGRDGLDRWLPPRRVLVPLVTGALAGAALSAWFNVFRYGSVRNVHYLNPGFRTPDTGHVVANFFNLFVAPAGGLFVFWPAVAVLLVAVTVMVVRAVAGRDVRTAVPAVLATGVLAVFALGLATWYAPFGWIAWGPRLFLPVVPAAVFVLVHGAPERLGRILARGLVSPVRFAVGGVVVLVGAFVQASGAWSVSTAVRTLQATDARCPTFGEAASETYWSCFNHISWRLNHTPIRTAVAGGDAMGWTARGVLVVGIALLLVDARSTARRTRPSSDDPPPSAGTREVESTRRSEVTAAPAGPAPASAVRRQAFGPQQRDLGLQDR